MSNPVDDFLDAKTKEAQARDQEDFQQWERWKKKPTKRNLGSLLKRFDPMFSRSVHQWKAKAVPTASFKADLQRNAIDAFESFDPNRGASLRTHVGNRIRRSQRFNAKYQNVAFIPEEKAALITPITQARETLFEELGKQPSSRQVAGFLNKNPGRLPKRVQGKVTPTLVKTVDAYQIRDIPGSSFESDPFSQRSSFDRETVELLRPSLKQEDQLVYDYLFGKNGKPKIESTSGIARALGRSDSQVSRAKRRIEATFKKYSG